MQNVYFSTSKLALKQVTDIYDFVWPTAVAIWNLRWQVAGYQNIRKDATEAELLGRFAIGSGIHGANLRRATNEHSWEQQQENFARFLLVNLIAVYEAWVADVLEAVNQNYRDLREQIQFPTGGMFANPKIGTARDPVKGVWNVINIVTNSESQMLKTAFYPTLLSNKKNSKAKLDNLLYCYRYFKECRNSIIHGGGEANETAEIAYQDFIPVSTSPSNLDIKEMPEHFPVTKGSAIHLSLRGVVGFSDVVRRLIITIDAELSRASVAEREFERRWLEKYGRNRMLKSSDANARQSQIARLVSGIELPKPIQTEDIDIYIQTHRLAR